MKDIISTGFSVILIVGAWFFFRHSHNKTGYPDEELITIPRWLGWLVGLNHKVNHIPFRNLIGELWGFYILIGNEMRKYGLINGRIGAIILLGLTILGILANILIPIIKKKRK